MVGFTVALTTPPAVATNCDATPATERARGGEPLRSEAAAARPANPRILDCEDARRSRHVHRGSEAGQMIRPGPEKHGVWPNLSLDNALLILGRLWRENRGIYCCCFNLAVSRGLIRLPASTNERTDREHVESVGRRWRQMVTKLWSGCPEYPSLRKCSP